MQRSAEQLRLDAEAIWQAGVRAVLPENLIGRHVRVEGETLWLGEESLELPSIGRIAVVGAGKAAAGMAVALEAALGARWMKEKQVTGWVNVPADCLLPTERIHLHAGRPAGVNEPRPEAAEGTEAILRLLASLSPDDLCVCLIAGGGSALLVAPVEGVSLDDKLRVTRLLSSAGANIEQLNTVRRQLSRVKGGGLARACRAGRLVTLVISDVLGDPLNVIASGPTVSSRSTPQDALAVFDNLGIRADAAAQPVVRFLEAKCRQVVAKASPASAHVTNIILANNAAAVETAGEEALRRGYSPAMISATASEGAAEEVGRHLAGMATRMMREPGPDCLISGGEPTVKLADEAVRGLGGRNQQLALAALEELGDAHGMALLSGGTDGEDGPTDAAGAIVDAQVVKAARRLQLDPRDYLRRNDAYHFFAAAGGLLKTGPTHTNVCDIRVVTVARDEE